MSVGGAFWIGVAVGTVFGLLLAWLRDSTLRKYWERRHAFMRDALRGNGDDKSEPASDLWKH